MGAEQNREVCCLLMGSDDLVICRISTILLVEMVGQPNAVTWFSPWRCLIVSTNEIALFLDALL